jgi:hypothetical protein
MFYLGLFFKSFKDHLFVSFSFSLFTLAITLFITNSTLVKHKLMGLYPKYLKGPHFHALINDQVDNQVIKNKLLKISDVKKVKIISEQKLEEQTLKILDQLNFGKNDGFNQRYSGLHVVLSRNISPRRLKLIRDYLKRLAQEDNITLGPTHKNVIDKNFKKFFDLFSGYGEFIIFFFLLLPWLLSLFYFQKKIQNTSFLIEEFQRKKAVKSKIILSGSIFILGSSVLISRYFSQTQWTLLGGIGLFLLLLPLFFWGRPSWKN